MGIGGLWNRIGAAFERSDIALAERAESEAAEDGAVRRTATRYSALRKAVERRVQAFLREDVVSHLEIGFDEVFELHYIELVPDAPGIAALEQFLEEFSPEARVQWVKKLLGPAVGKHVSVEQFLGLDREFTAEELAETDPFEEKLNQGATPLYRVILHGRWQRGLPVSKEQVQPAATVQARIAGPCVRLSIQDAGSAGAPRALEVDRYPVVLGSSAQADVEISGYYVSARHCTLHWEGERLWLADHSTNGTWVDGEHISRGARMPLANGAVVGFGRDRGDAEHDRYPALRIHVQRKAGGLTTTPVSPSSATPVAPAIARPETASTRETPLAMLSIVDATGNAVRDVPELPYTIGRGSSQDYVVPDANQGVSREHLVLEEITASGAVVANRAVDRNGTFANGKALAERFTWRFGEEIVLGERWSSAPPVRIALRRTKEPA
jgi:pSer/pThr/pTyr-binding forkhead associated (FHA) protein